MRAAKAPNLPPADGVVWSAPLPVLARAACHVSEHAAIGVRSRGTPISRAQRRMLMTTPLQDRRTSRAEEEKRRHDCHPATQTIHTRNALLNACASVRRGLRARSPTASFVNFL